MIRNLEFIAFENEFETEQELIESVSWDTELGFVTVGFRANAANVIEALQKNERFFAQSSEGIYQVQYFCPFRFLVPAYGNNIKLLTLGLKSVNFHRDQFVAVKE